MNPTTIALVIGGAYLLSRGSQAAPAGGGSGAVNSSVGGTGAPSQADPLGGILSGITSALTNVVNSVTNKAGTTAPAGTSSGSSVSSDTFVPTGQTVINNAPVQQAASAVSVTDLYHSILHRDPDAAGLAYWTEHLGSTIDNTDEYKAFYLAAVPEIQQQQGLV